MSLSQKPIPRNCLSFVAIPANSAEAGADLTGQQKLQFVAKVVLLNHCLLATWPFLGVAVL